jgi:RNA polymerase sigma-70 factor (ECF subfamily)
MQRVKEIEDVSDGELVMQFQRGDEAAFDTLVRRHQQRAFNIAFGLLHEREDALEVAQDAFVRAYGALKEFRGDAAFTTWLYRITMNLAHNKSRWNRTRGSGRSLSLDAPADPNEPNGRNAIELADASYGPDGQAMVTEETRLIGVAMEKMEAKSREVLILRNVENLSYEEISEVLECELGTVKSRINRAREELRALMDDLKL